MNAYLGFGVGFGFKLSIKYSSKLSGILKPSSINK